MPVCQVLQRDMPQGALGDSQVRCNILHHSYRRLTLLHRPLCLSLQQMRPSGSKSDVPCMPTDTSILRSWLVSHDFTLQQLVIFALMSTGTLAEFDYRQRYLRVKLTYQPEHRGNCAVAFTVDSAQFEEWAHGLVEPALLKRLKRDEAMVSCLHTLRRAGNPDYIHNLHILYDMSVSGHSGGVWDSRPVYRLRPGLEQYIRAMLGEGLQRWEEDLKATVAAGIVFMKTPMQVVEGVNRHEPGRLEKREGKLVWVQMMGEENDAARRGLVGQLLEVFYAAAVEALGGQTSPPLGKQEQELEA